MAQHKLKINPRKGVVVPPDVPNIFDAAELNDVKKLQVALEYYDVNERDPSGLTPLHYAASTLANDAIDLLLSQPNIDATLRDNFGRTASFVAIESWDYLGTETADKLYPHCYPRAGILRQELGLDQ